MWKRRWLRRGCSACDAHSTSPALPIESATPDRYELALAEARRGFDEQLAQFSRLRATTGGLVGYGGVAFSILVVAPGQTTGPNSFSLLQLAAAFFCLLGILSTFLLAPVRVVPGSNASDLVTWADAKDDTGGSMTRDLALHYESAYQQNRRKLEIRTRVLVGVLICFALMILILAIRLMGA